ncbi:hypothetical protein Y032_0037g3425 [Ancylostoma ceylanicum]|uniref:TFIIF beta subunit N-terminal domain-containing protein n=1 Tax=Ancylostoma ceylanicum TaxID=53326 RepID=A0A016UL72_9BILA|nr:hypothetical protein Y032_0037g3425 [Ancylostoma ceylanicum]
MSAAGMSRKREHAVDCEMAKRGVWLVKVPRYLSDLWEANAGTDVGRLVIHQGANGKGDSVLSFAINLAFWFFPVQIFLIVPFFFSCLFSTGNSSNLTNF